MGARFDSPTERRAAMQEFAARAGDCSPASTSSTAMGGLIGRTSGTAGFHPDTASVRWLDYVASIVTGLQTAKSLDDAREMIDAHVATAAADDSLSAVDLDIVAAAAQLTTSSAIEWDTYFRPLEGSLFIWGWLSAIGDWIVEVVTADVVGCVAGSVGILLLMAGMDWSGDGSEFVSWIVGGCEAGGIVGSVLAAF